MKYVLSMTGAKHVPQKIYYVADGRVGFPLWTDDIARARMFTSRLAASVCEASLMYHFDIEEVEDFTERDDMHDCLDNMLESVQCMLRIVRYANTRDMLIERRIWCKEGD